jgi:hypothetical protein
MSYLRVYCMDGGRMRERGRKSRSNELEAASGLTYPLLGNFKTKREKVTFFLKDL